MAEVNATPGSEVSPNQTIYINNLNEKIKLDGIFNLFFSVYLCGFNFMFLASEIWCVDEWGLTIFSFFVIQS